MYVRDAQGNTLATYTVTDAGSASAGTLLLDEHYIYGSDRVGTVKYTNFSADRVHRAVKGYSASLDDSTYAYNFTRGNKLFELTNHLGNVVATITDGRDPKANGSTGFIATYDAIAVSSTDYSPFGMPLTLRNANISKYRYGFNGKEMDHQVWGAGNELDYGMRVYDPRVGRFLSVDPLTHSFPWNSPYAYAENDVIRSIDFDGAERLVKTYYQVIGDRATKLTQTNGDAIHQIVENQNWSGQKDVNVFFVSTGKRSGEYVFYDSREPGEAESKMRQDGIILKHWDRKLPSTVSIIKQGLTSQDPQLVAFRETVKNYFTALSSIFTMGGSTTIQVTGAAKSVLSSSLGKAGFDAFTQLLTKGGFEKIDWSDAAVSGFVKNSDLKAFLKSFVDASGENGLNIKKLNEGLKEMGLRLVNDELISGKTTGAGKYVVDVVKKIVLNAEKEVVKPQADQTNEK